MTVVSVCLTCRLPHLRAEVKQAKAEAEVAGVAPPAFPTPCGEHLLAEVERAAAGVDGVSVRGVACLMGCSHGCNVAVSDPDKMTYVLGDFEPTADAAEAVVAFAAGHAGSDSGVVPFKAWPEGVKGRFKARVPPIER
ncbi:MAG: DUF1636 domain-containing protein [Pseudomonadota bacterium]